MKQFIGTQIKQYQIEALLGEGGMGVVYRAYDLQADRPVAIKIMLDSLVNKPQFRQRFMQEAAAIQQFNSPSIIRVFDTGEVDGSPFIVMEYVEGGSLIDYLKQLQWSGRKMPLEEIVTLGSQVAEGLAYAHQRGLIHRDVKPGNILLRLREGNGRHPHQAVIIDFGLAVTMKEGDEVATNPFMGSLAYMSPEQCENLPLDGRSDIYSLGIVLYQLTTGQLPFQINAPVDIVKHIQEPPLPPRLLNPELPEIIDTVILKAMAKKASERYQTAAEMAYALRQSLTNEALLTAVPGGSGVVTQWLDSKWVTDVTVEDRVDVHRTWTSSGDYRLFVVHQWEESQIYDLDKEVVTLGRSRDGQVVLPDRSVSGQHARLTRTPTGWQIEDLGSTNGTVLAGRPLEYGKPLDWPSYETVRIGPYFLRWQPFSEQRKEREAAATLAAMAAALPQAEPEAAFTSPTNGRTMAAGVALAAGAALAGTAVLAETPESRALEFTPGEVLGIAVTPSQMELEPGAELPLVIAVTNRDVTVKDVGLRLELNGRPPSWVTLAQSAIKLLPEETKTVEALVGFTFDYELLSGVHNVKIIATTDKGEVEIAPVQFTVPEREDFTLDLHPSNLQEKVTCRLTITDRSNFPNEYTVMGIDDSDALLFNFTEPQNAILSDFSDDRQTLKVTPGQEAYLGFSLRPRKRPWFAQNKVLPFKIRVRTQKSDWQSLTGQVEIRPRISRRVLLFFLLFLLVIGGVGYLAFLQIEQAQAERLQELQAIADKANEDAAAAQARAAEAQQRLDEARAAGASEEELAALQAQADAAAQEAAALEQAAQAASGEAAAAATEADLTPAATAVAQAASTPAATPTAVPTPVPNRPPTNITLDSLSLDENVTVGTVVGSFTAEDPDVAFAPADPGQKPRALFRRQQQAGAFTFSLVSGTGSTDNALFVVDGRDLKTAAEIDYETKSQLSIRVQVDDGAGGTFQKSFTLSVTNLDDVPEFSIANVTVSEGAGKAVVTVSVSGGNGDEATVDFDLTAGTGKAGVDYTAVSDTLTWEKGNADPQEIEIPILDNERDEPDRTFSVVLSNPDKATLGVSTAIVTITDDDDPPALTIANLSVAESIAGGRATISVVMQGSSSRDVSVQYATVNETAVSGQDYTPASGTLTWTAGQTGARSFDVAILQDVVDEPDETLTVNLTNPQGATLTVEKATLTISDDDAQPRITIGDTAVAEDAGSVTVTITMTGATSEEAWVDLTTQNGTLETNAATGDGSLRDFDHQTASLTWEAGASGARQMTVTILDDSVDEGDDATQPEIFSVVIFSNAPSVLVQDNAATVQIKDNDAPPVVKIVPANPATVEESAGIITLNAEMTGQSSRAVTANFTLLEGAATLAEDFAAVSAQQQVSWAPYETGQKPIQVSIIDDKVDENAWITDTVQILEDFTLRLAAPTAATLGTPAETAVSIRDNDQAGVTIGAPLPASIQEDPDAPTASRTASYAVRLTSRPLADVSFSYSVASTAPPASPAHTQCSVVNTSPLVFTPSNWNTNQTVSVRAIDESYNDQGGTCRIVLTPDTTDVLYAQFSDIQGAPVTVVNEDDPQILLGPTGGLLFESPISGTNTLTYTVRLSTRPVNTVSVLVDPNSDVQIGRSQATLGAPGVPFTLTFPSNTAVISQTVFVQAVNNNIDEAQDPHPGVIVHTSGGTSDYNGLTVNNTINITNDDTAEIRIGLLSSTIISETTDAPNHSATFTTTLGSRPISDVTLNFAASNTQCTVSPESTTFAANSDTDWATIRTVTVTAVNDAIDDGDQNCTAQITVTTTDPAYQTDPADLMVSVADDDQAGFIIDAPVTVLTDTADLNTATFQVFLTSEPVADVQLAFTSSNAACSVSTPGPLTSTNYASGVSVTVTAVTNDIADFNQTCLLSAAVTSSDSNYDTLTPPALSFSVINDDVAGYTFSPTALTLTDSSGLNSASFVAMLTSEPLANVALTFSSSDPLCQPPASAVTLTPANWQTGVTVNVTTAADNIDQGVASRACSLTAVVASTDGSYTALTPPALPVTVLNDDEAGFTVSPTALTVTDTVGVNTAVFNLRLTSQPTANVNVTFGSNNPAVCTVSTPAALTAGNWATGVSVTVTAVPDNIDNTARTCLLSAASIIGDPLYIALGLSAVPPVSVSVQNDDQVAIVMSVDTLSLTDTTGQNTAAFTIRLASEPTGPVTIPLISDNSLCTVPSPQVIPAANWQTGVSVTVTAVADDIDQGADRVCNLTGGDPSSPDPNYNALASGDVPGIHVDVLNDDAAGISRTSPTPLTISETVTATNHTATFTVMLDTQPSGDVQIPLAAASANNVCSVSGNGPGGNSVILTSANWQAGALVTITATANNTADPDQTCTVSLGPVANNASQPAEYRGLNGADVQVQVLNDD